MAVAELVVNYNVMVVNCVINVYERNFRENDCLCRSIVSSGCDRPTIAVRTTLTHKVAITDLKEVVTIMWRNGIGRKVVADVVMVELKGLRLSK